MFQHKIDKPIYPLTNAIINSVSRPTPDVDYTLVTLGFALLKPRMKFTGFAGKYINSYQLSSALSDGIYHLRNKCNFNIPTLITCMYGCHDMTPDDTLNTLEGFSRFVNFERYIEQKAHVKVYILTNREKNAAFLVLPNKLELYHLVLSLFSKLFPSYFEDQPLTKQEIAYQMTLKENSEKEFIQMSMKILDPIRNDIVRDMLKDCLDSMQAKKIDSAEQAVANTQYELDRLYNEYQNSLKKRQEAIIRLEGLKLNISNQQAPQEIVNCIAENPLLTNLSMSDNILSFIVDTTLTNIDADAWRNFSQTNEAYNWRFGSELDCFEDTEIRKMFLDAIFKNPNDPDLKIKMCGYFAVDIDMNRLDSQRGYDYIAANPVYESRIPNPHLHYYNCLNEYRTMVSECVAEGDLLGAVEYCIASAGSVNLDEVSTFKKLLAEVMSSTKKILINRDGQEMTPEEAVIWLYDKEHKDERDQVVA